MAAPGKTPRSSLGPGLCERESVRREGLHGCDEVKDLAISSWIFGGAQTQ